MYRRRIITINGGYLFSERVGSEYNTTTFYKI
jgi:hypothetical protein